MMVVRKVYAFGTMKPIDQSYLHSLADLCNVVLCIINFGKITKQLLTQIYSILLLTYALPSQYLSLA